MRGIIEQQALCGVKDGYALGTRPLLFLTAALRNQSKNLVKSNPLSEYIFLIPLLHNTEVLRLNPLF